MELWYAFVLAISSTCIAVVLWAVANHRKRPLPRAPVRNDRPRLAAAESLSADDGRRSNAAPARSRRATSSGNVDEEWQRVEGPPHVRRAARHGTIFHDRGGSHDEQCRDRSDSCQSSHVSSQQQPHSNSMLPRHELEGRLAQLTKDVKHRDHELARAKRRLIAMEAENEELKKKLALAASLREAPMARRASEPPPRGDPVPATPLPTRSKSRETISGGKGRAENEKKPARKPSTVLAKEQPKVATDKGKSDRGREHATSSVVGRDASVASEAPLDTGAAAGSRRLPNEGASLEARWSSFALSHYAARGAPPGMPDVPPTPLVGFLQSLLCRVKLYAHQDTWLCTQYDETEDGCAH